MDLTKTDAVKEKLDAFVLSAEQELKDGGYSKIAKIRDQAKSFGKVSEDTFYDTVDLYDLSDKMELLYPKESSDLKSGDRINRWNRCQCPDDNTEWHLFSV